MAPAVRLVSDEIKQWLPELHRAVPSAPLDERYEVVPAIVSDGQGFTQRKGLVTGPLLLSEIR